jgi:DMSO/TMAO reductase YedYZ heme-binding membrane subunit
VQTIWVVVGGALWLIGGNVIVAVSCRRRGLPWSSGFRPFNYRPLLGMSWVEWLAVVLLAVTSLAIMGLGMRSK